MGSDPREIITPDAFQVAPELIGTPLARPWRRGVAMLIDLIAIGILNLAGGFVLGAVISFVSFRLAIKPKPGRWNTRGRRIVLAALGSTAMVATVSGLVCGRLVEDGLVVVVADGVTPEERGPGAAATIAIAAATIPLEGDPEKLTQQTQELVRELRAAGVPENKIRATVEGLADSRDEVWAKRRVLDVLASGAPVAAEEPADEETLVLAYAEALRARNEDEAVELRSRMQSLLSRRSTEPLQAQISELKRKLESAEDALEAEQERGFLAHGFTIADELGFGVGWSAVYFTALLIFWRGQTLGKRIMRLRVVRLNGKAIGLWSSFNRFGGYAASIFTGLLGFAEMFWDRNRQALHDRISATVVILDGHSGQSRSTSPDRADP